MERRTLIGAALTGLTIPNAFAQGANAGRRHRDLFDNARRQTERFERERDSLTSVQRANRYIDLAELELAVHAAQEREFDRFYVNFTAGPTTKAAMNLSSAAIDVDIFCVFDLAPSGDAEMRRLRAMIPVVRQRTLECAQRYASSSGEANYIEWLARVRAFNGQAAILAAAFLGDMEGVSEAVAELALPRERLTSVPAVQALATGYGMLGRHERANQEATALLGRYRPTIERHSTDRAASLTMEYGDVACTAAFAAANANDWRAAWEHLLFARELRAGVPTLQSLEPAIWQNFDALAAMVTDRNGSHLWLATKTGGFAQTRKFVISGNRNVIERRYFFQIPDGDTIDTEDVGWGALTMIAANADDATRDGLIIEMKNRLADLSAHCPPGFEAAFTQLAQSAQEQGVRRLAWLPSPPLCTFPVGVVLNQRGRTAGDLRISMLASLADVSAGVSETIASASALPVSGGDENIPLARVERDLVAALSPSSDNTGPWALHIASHAAVRESRMHVKVGSRTWISVDELQRRANWRQPPRLVILSACGSFIDADNLATSATGDRVHSPARDLIALGIPGVIGTLWETNDLAAFMFSSRLHLSLLRDQLDPRTAFQRIVNWLRTSSHSELTDHIESLVEGGKLTARDSEAILSRLVDMPDEAPFAAPYYWAAWTYWGT